MVSYSKEYIKHKSKVEKALGFVPYDVKPIAAIPAQYRCIYGERSNGKTYQVMERCLYDYVTTGAQFAYVRRLSEDFKGKRGAELLAAFSQNGSVSAMTAGEWDSIKYYSGRWYLQRTEVQGEKFVTVTSDDPIGYAFALTATEHDKGSSYRRVKHIVFDEFISRTMYLDDEFILFMNTCSTIIRDRKDVEIWMLGNTVNKYCPYFDEMGLTHARDLKPGEIEVYTYGDSGLKVAVEHTKPNAKGKESDVYFAFDNPKLKMITSGEWEIDIYPHIPKKYRPKDVVVTCYIKWDREALRLDLIDDKAGPWVAITPKTSPIKNEDEDFIYSVHNDPRANWFTSILVTVYPFQKLLLDLMKRGKWFYATNTCGEIMRNYLMWCGLKL